MAKKKTIAMIEPCYYGMGFVDVAYARGYDIISIVASEDNPKIFGYEGKYKDLIIADIREANSIIEAINNYPHKNDIDALIAANDYVTHIGSKVAEYFGLKHIPYKATNTARFKDKARNAYSKAGLPNAKHALASNFTQAKEVVKEIGYPVVVKPTNCACSQHVYLIENEIDLKKACDTLAEFDSTYLDFKPSSKFLIEEYITGEEFSVEMFMSQGKPIFSTVTEKIKSKPPYFVELGHVIPSSTHQDKIDELIDAATKAMLACGLTDGPAHVELRLSPKGPIVMETNARPGGDLIAQELLINAFDVNLFDATLDFYLDKPVSIKKRKNISSAIAYLVAPHDGQIIKGKGWENLSHNPDIVSSSFSIKEGDIVNFPKSSGDRLGHVIVNAPTPHEAKKKAFEIIDAIELEIK